MADIPTCPDHLLLAVFDGHGGSAASKYAYRQLLNVLEQTDFWKTYLITHLIEDLSEALRETFLVLDRQMLQGIRDDGMKCGCTSVVTIVTPTHIICANAGDSRCILSTRRGDNTTQSLIPLSNDHKPQSKEESLRIHTAGGYVTTRRTGGVSRVDGILAVSRGLGDFRFKQRADLPSEMQKVSLSYLILFWFFINLLSWFIYWLIDSWSCFFHKVTCNPEIIVHVRHIKDEFIILGCDGIWDVLSSDDVIKLVQTLYSEGENNEKLIAEELIDESFAKGSKDNISVIVVRLPGAVSLISKVATGGVLKRRSRRTGEQELSALFLPTGTYCLNENPLYPFRNINTGN